MLTWMGNGMLDMICDPKPGDFLFRLLVASLLKPSILLVCTAAENAPVHFNETETIWLLFTIYRTRNHSSGLVLFSSVVQYNMCVREKGQCHSLVSPAMLASPSQSIRLSVYKSSLAAGHPVGAEGIPMRTPESLLRTNPSPPLPPPLVTGDEHAGGGGEQQAISVDSDTVVILASLLCALICVAGLALVARCTCRRPRQGSSSSGGGRPSTTQGAEEGGDRGAAADRVFGRRRRR